MNGTSRSVIFLPTRRLYGLVPSNRKPVFLSLGFAQCGTPEQLYI